MDPQNCPYCGHIAYTTEFDGAYMVYCSDITWCGFTGPGEMTAEIAIRQWNRIRLEAE